MTQVLKVESISKRIGGKTLVNRISFDIRPGEIYGLLGPNGAGKTTTIRMLVGLIEPSEGSIAICGHDIRKSRREAMKCVGTIVENPELYKYLSGYENLRQFARLAGGVTDAKIKEIIELVGLEQRINEKVKRYSLGMRQRLGLAQALLHDPSLLILDEPTNGLDPAGMREFRQLLKKLAARGTSILISSHLLAEIEQVCDRVGVIQNGKWVLAAEVDELRRQQTSSRRLLLHVDSVERALALLNNSGVDAEATGQEGRIIAYPQGVSWNPLLWPLLDGGVQLYGIEEETASLEDKFLEITGGNVI